MKKIVLLGWITCFLCFWLCSAANATPIIYTFEGTLRYVTTSLDGDEEGEWYDGSYKILLDYDRHGSTTSSDGTVTTYPFEQEGMFGSPRYTYYADYIGGSPVQGAIGSLYEENYFVAEQAPNQEGYFYLSSAIMALTLEWYGGGIPYMGDPLVIGDLYWLHNGFTESDGSKSRIDGYVNITAMEPVPEPATIALLGVGLLGMVGASRKRLKRK